MGEDGSQTCLTKGRITEEPVQLKAACRTSVTLVCRQLKVTTDKKIKKQASLL